MLSLSKHRQLACPELVYPELVYPELAEGKGREGKDCFEPFAQSLRPLRSQEFALHPLRNLCVLCDTKKSGFSSFYQPA